MSVLGRAHVKEPYEMSMAWEPDRRSNFNPPAHLCAVTYMTEIALIVTLNNLFTFTLPFELNRLFYVTSNDISVIYVTAHRCAGGLKKK